MSGRGTIFYHIADYSNQARPKILILEKVKGLVTFEQGKYLQEIFEVLNSIGRTETSGSGAYEIHHEVLNTMHHGVPQSRPRWYCVGIRRSLLKTATKSPFCFPGRIPCPDMELFFDEGEAPTSSTVLSNTAQKNVDNALKRILRSGDSSTTGWHIVDCDASSARSTYACGYITRSRYAGHYIIKKDRRMSINEMFRLQGGSPANFKVAVSDSELGKLIGNAMSVNVIERVLLQALQATGRISGTEDRWESGEAVKNISGHFGPKVKDPVLPGQSQFPFQSAGVRRLIVDSGASFYLIDTSTLTKEALATKRKLKAGISLNTANGQVKAQWEADIYVQELECWLPSLLLQNTPAVLSLGRLVENEGFEFIWKTHETPYLLRGDTKVLCWPSHDDVPSITAAKQASPKEKAEAKAKESQSQTGGDPAETQPTQEKKKDDKGKPPTRGDPVESKTEQPQTGGDPVQRQEIPPPPTPTKEQRAVKRRRDKRKIHTSKETIHNIFTHFPKDPDCEICQRN